MLASTIQISNNNPTPPHPPHHMTRHDGQAWPGRWNRSPRHTPQQPQGHPHGHSPEQARTTGGGSDSSEPQQCVCLDPHPTHNREGRGHHHHTRGRTADERGRRSVSTSLRHHSCPARTAGSWVCAP